MNSLIRAALYCWILLVSATAQGQPKVNWADPDSSRALRLAINTIESGQLPEVETELARHISIRITAESIYTNVIEVVYLPSFNEANNEGTKTIYWDEATEDLVINEAAVVLPDGSYRRMRPENIRVRDTDVYNTFTNSREVVVPLSGLADKSVTVLEYETSVKISDLESIYSDAFYPVAFSRPVRHFELKLDAQDGFDINWSNIHSDISCEYEAKKLDCTAHNLEKFDYEDHIFWRDELPQIRVAQKSDWSDVVQYVRSAFENSDYRSDAVKRYAKELISGISDKKQQIQKLHEFASRGIRYVSMSELGHRITPHSFDHVISNLFGDCKDKSAVLVGLLEAIGIEATPVLVATERRDPAMLKVPSSRYFDHMVVCFELEEEQYCLDPTDTSTHWQSISSSIQGRVALFLENDVAPTTLPQYDYKWVVRSESVSTFDEKAAVVEKQRRLFSGNYAAWYRSGLESLDTEGQIEALKKSYTDTVSSLPELSFEYDDPSDFANIFKVSSEAIYEPYTSSSEDLNLTEQDAWLRAEITGSKVTEGLKYGRWLDGTYIESTVYYDLTALWDISRKPAALSFEDEQGLYLRRKTNLEKDGRLKITTELWIKSQYLQPEQIEDFNTKLDILLDASNIHIEGQLKNSTK